MPGSFSVTCACGRRHGWFGDWDEAPPCPRCGAVPEPDPAVERRIARERARLLARMSKSEGDPSADTTCRGCGNPKPADDLAPCEECGGLFCWTCRAPCIHGCIDL